MRKQTLMIQGTTSDAGKSTVVTALCRILKNKHYRVAPFKPQNMALNSAVTADGGEIGRAQAVQAYACGLAPHTDMNPVLLKPNSDIGAQIIIHGKAIGNQNAVEYHAYKQTAQRAVLESYQRLTENYDAVIVEGAGSPAEINLRANDIANMGFAEAVDCPVIIVADIDRGGVFAHLVGTLALLSESEQARVKGFIINRFRGDIALLQSGLDWLETYTKKPVLGVIPYIKGFHLEAEDALPRELATINCKEAFHIIVPVLPRISNHTDFDPLRLHPDVYLQFIGPDQTIPPCDLIILPGSKSVQADLAWLRAQGWEQAIQRHMRFGGKVIGICGGYQMLGMALHDPRGIEGDAASVAGLGLLNVETTLENEKQLRNIRGRLFLEEAVLSAYEIHAGVTVGEGLKNPVLETQYGNDGAISEDNLVLGCYSHGLFEQASACNAMLRWAGLTMRNAIDYDALRDAEIERLATVFETHLDMARILKIMQLEAEEVPA